MDESKIYSFAAADVAFHHSFNEHPDPEDFDYRLHSHHMHEIYYFKGGCADFTVEGNRYKLKKGTLIFSAGGQVHHVAIKDSAIPYERLVFMFAIDRFPALISDIVGSAEKGFHVYHLNEREQIWFEESCDTVKNEKMSDNVRREAVSALIGMIITKLSAREDMVSPSESAENDTVGELVRYLNRNLMEPITLDMIEREFFRDRAYLNRCFKSAVGCSIWEYVIRKRIAAARGRLILTGQVSEAFAASGFRDYSVFYRNYVKCTGMSPAADLRAMRRE